MKKVGLMILCAIFFSYCTVDTERENIAKNNIILDSTLIKNEIIKDSTLFNLLYSQALSNFKQNVSEQVILQSNKLEIKRYYYKNRLHLFNYFLFKSQDTSFAIQFNFMYYLERISDLNKIPNNEVSKKYVSFLKYRSNLENDLNKINKFLINEKDIQFQDLLKLLFENSEKIKLIDKINFNEYFNYKRYIALGCEESIVKLFKDKIENSLNEPETVVGYSNNVFIVIKSKNDRVFVEYFFEDFANGWYL